MKKFQSLGRRLSIDEQKGIKGGTGDPGGGGGTVYGWCTNVKGCWQTTSSLETCRANITANCSDGKGSCDTTDGCPW